MQKGDLLKVCANATRFEELDSVLIEGSEQLYAEYRGEFHTAMTTLFQTAEAERATLLKEAELAVQKVRNAREKTKPRMWGNDAARKEQTEEDPYLEEGVKQELAVIKAGYQEELAAVLTELQVKMDDIAKRFASLHLECMSNARAIVEYHTGFTMHDSQTKSDAGATQKIDVV